MALANLHGLRAQPAASGADYRADLVANPAGLATLAQAYLGDPCEAGAGWYDPPPEAATFWPDAIALFDDVAKGRC